MNQNSEQALVQILTSNPALAARITDRATWDDSEIDMPQEGLTLRTLSTRFPAGELRGRGGLWQALVEISARAVNRIAASQLADAVVAALDPCEQGPFEVSLSSGAVVRFGAIRLDGVQQAPSGQQKSYRKLLTYSVTYYE